MKNLIVQIIPIPRYRLIFLLLFCCHSFITGISQSAKTGNLNPAASDSIKADQLNALSKKFWRENRDSSVYYAQKAREVSQSLNYKRGIAESYRNVGVTNLFIGNWNVSKQNLLKALDLYTAMPDRKGMAATYNNLGVLYVNQEEFSASLACYDSALILFRNIGDQEGEGSVLNYIGINYQEQGNFQKAIDYCLQAFEIRKKINDHPGVVFSLINVGNMYLAAGQPQTALTMYNQSVSYATDHGMEPVDYSLNQIGKTYLQLKQYDKAEKYLIRTINGKKMQVNDHLTAGELYLMTDRTDSAIRQFTISLEQASPANKINMTLSLAGLSKVFLKRKEWALARRYANQAYDLADSSQNRLIVADVANVLAILHKNSGEYKEALKLFELAHSITDSIAGGEYQRKLAFTESKNEIENQQTQLKLLSSEKKLQQQKIEDEQFLKKLILSIFAVAIIASLLIISNINRKRKKIQSQKDQIELQNSKVELAYEKLKSTQALLIQREKMASLGELTAGIAHEIQNPLNFVNNFSEINKELLTDMKNEMGNGNLLDAKSIANVIIGNEEKINHHGKRAEAIVKGMLQHSRTSTGQKEPADINALTDEYLRIAYRGIKGKDSSFNPAMNTDYDESLSAAGTDAGKISIVPQDIGRVLLNLYSNAFYAVNEKRKQHPPGYQPTVSVSTKKLNDKTIKYGVEIIVQDNGNGIPDKIIDKIFQPFFTTKPTGQGTGLGLSLSYDIVKAHGGEIIVRSSESEGTRFIVQLPGV